jgi:hypothetical protein
MPKSIAKKVIGLKKPISKVIKQTPKSGLDTNIGHAGGGWTDQTKGEGFRKKS